MHVLTLKNCSLVTFILASPYVIAWGKKPPEQNAETQPVQNVKTQDEMMAGYNASCRIAVDRPYDFFISGSFTYWQPTQENMQLGVVSEATNEDLVHGKAADLDFDYKPGFKVGLGMNFGYDQWDSYMEYTWFRGTDHVNKNLNETNLLPAWQIPDFLNPHYASGSEKWKLTMDLVDWDLGRSYFVGKKLCFRPFVGLRFARIDQKVDVDYTNTSSSAQLIWPSTSIDQKSNSWGIGPRLGLCSDWRLGGGWMLYSKGEADILFTQYDLKMKQSSNATLPNGYVVRQNDVDYLRTHLELDLGLGWGTYFYSKKYHIDFRADYGFQVFFDQNMFRSTPATFAVGKGTVPNGNLYMQGLTVTARFDF